MLYQKVRPTSIDEIIGSDLVVSSVKQTLSQPEHPHVFLLKGQVGCGKTTLALIIASMVGCLPDNIYRINAAGNNGVDSMRQLSNEAHIYGMGGGNKCYILDECHEVTKQGWDELLEVLEFCPEHCYFILLTTEPNKVIKAVRSRCVEYELNTLTEAEIKTILGNVCKSENLTIDQDLIDTIAIVCEGSPRNAIQLLEQVIGITDVDKAMDLIVRGTLHDATVIDLCKLLIVESRLRFENWSKIVQTFDSIKAEPEVIRKSILTFVFNKLVRCNPKDTTIAMDYAHLLREFSPSTFYGGRAQLGAMIAKFVLGG